MWYSCTYVIKLSVTFVTDNVSYGVKLSNLSLVLRTLRAYRVATPLARDLFIA